jgi:hypothetical protein
VDTETQDLRIHRYDNTPVDKVTSCTYGSKHHRLQLAQSRATSGGAMVVSVYLSLGDSVSELPLVLVPYALHLL